MKKELTPEMLKEIQMLLSKDLDEKFAILNSENFDEIFEKLPKNILNYHNAYTVWQKFILNMKLEDLYFCTSGVTFEGFGYMDNEGKPLTENSSRCETFEGIKNEYNYLIELLDKSFHKYAEKIKKKNLIQK